jgi:2-phospho-L-lactate guanylyltransferase
MPPNHRAAFLFDCRVTGSLPPDSDLHRRSGSIGWVRWRVLIPVKPPEVSKSRLQGATRASDRHADLVLAIQRDTITAIAAAIESGPLIRAAYLIGSVPLAPLPSGIEVLSDSGGGLNDALAQAAIRVSGDHPGDGIVAVVADLPALRPTELLDVLARAPEYGRGYVADQSGAGTTLLTASSHPLEPLFGRDSAERHRQSGAIALPAGPSVRTDVDTAEDLQRCLVLGVGEHTASMVAHLV